MTHRWWRIAISCRDEDTDAVAAALIDATGQAVEEPDAGSLLTVATSEADAKRIVAELSVVFADLEGAVTPLEPVDWSVKWRDGIITRSFGNLTLTPSWLPVRPSGDQVVVTLDPESAFGSGEHGSTRAALQLLQRHIIAGQRVLDFGSGSGILAIAAAKLGAVSAIGIEVDDEAFPIAEANASKNDVADRVTFLVGDAGELGVLAGPAEIVCSNILRSVNTLLLPSIEKALIPGGLAIFSGMEDAEESLFRPVLAQHGFSVVEDLHDAGWWAVAARRR
ncbi:MAG: 50S ribosomal protein L11 methyltransferase [Gemmatimonadales bacterium]